MANGCWPTRIALLLPDLTGGGVERTTVSLAQGLLDRGLEIDLVLCRVRRPLLAEVPKAARIVPLPRSNLLLGRLLMAAADPAAFPSSHAPFCSRGAPRARYECCPPLRATSAVSGRRR